MGPDFHDVPVFEVRYACPRPGYPAPEQVLRIPEDQLSPEERRRLNRWE